MDVVVRRIDPTASNPFVQTNAAVGFRTCVVRVTADEYESDSLSAAIARCPSTAGIEALPSVRVRAPVLEPCAQPCLGDLVEAGAVGVDRVEVRLSRLRHEHREGDLRPIG